MKKFLLLVSLCALLVGCGKGGMSADVPQWYLDSKSDMEMYYGVGSGPTLNRAKASAINDIASQLSVNISSTTNIKDSSVDGYMTSKSDSNVMLSVDNIELPNIEIMNNTLKDNLHYVQVGINKRELAEHFQTLFNAKVEKLGYIKSSCGVLNAKEYFMLQDGIQNATKNATLANNIISNTANLSKLNYAKNLLKTNFPKPAARLNLSINDSSKRDLFTSAITKELVHFYTIEDTNQQTINININVQRVADGFQASLNGDIFTCDSTVFGTTIYEKQKTLNALANRVGIVLYKKILEWSEDKQ